MDLLADAAAGITRISLLGAARTLLAYPAPPQDAAGEFAVPRAGLDSPHGHLTALPPPLTLDDRTIEHAIGTYGGAQLAWSDRPG